MAGKVVKGALLVMVLTGVVACAHPERVPAPPEALAAEAEIPGLPGVRYRIDSVDEMIDDAWKRAGKPVSSCRNLSSCNRAA